MVYCDFKNKTDKSVVYAYGGRTDDITGEFAINLSDLSFEIVKEPENSVVYLRHLMSLFYKYQSDFSNGVFKPKIAYQSH